MNLSKSLIALLAVALVTTVASAQDKSERKDRAGGHGRHGGSMTDLLWPTVLEKLDLTAEQKPKYDELQAGFKKDATQYMTENKIDMEQMRKVRESGDEAAKQKSREQMKGLMDIRKGYIEKLQPILTAEQKTTLQEEQEKMRQQRGGRGEGKGKQKPAQ